MISIGADGCQADPRRQEQGKHSFQITDAWAPSKIERAPGVVEYILPISEQLFSMKSSLEGPRTAGDWAEAALMRAVR